MAIFWRGPPYPGGECKGIRNTNTNTKKVSIFYQYLALSRNDTRQSHSVRNLNVIRARGVYNEYFAAQQLSQIFKNKVDKIRSATAGAPSPAFAPRCESQLVIYRPVTTDEVRRLLSHVPNKQCSLDPVPTWLLTNTVPDIIARLINVSLQSGMFPSSQQHALVKPVLKKPQLHGSNWSEQLPTDI